MSAGTTAGTTAGKAVLGAALAVAMVIGGVPLAAGPAGSRGTAVAQEQEDPVPRASDEALERWVRFLGDRDERLADIAEEQLRREGARAIPFLEAGRTERNAARVDALLAELRRIHGDDDAPDDPGADDPGADDPGADDPGADDPGADDPGGDDPGADDPGGDTEPDTDPGADDPAMPDDGAEDDPAAGDSDDDTLSPEVVRWLEGRFRKCRETADDGRLEDALEMLDALLLLEPRLPFRREARRYRVHLQEQLLSRRVLPASAEPTDPVVTAGSDVEVTLNLVNGTTDDLVLVLSEALGDDGDGTVDATITLTVSEERWDPTGAVNTVTSTEVITVDDPARAVLAPGDRAWRRVTVTIGEEQTDSPLLLRVVTVEASMRPVRIETSGRTWHRDIVFQPAVILGVPPDRGDIVDAPLAVLRDAVDARNPADIFLAGASVRGADRALAGDILVDLMQEAPSRAEVRAAAAAMTRITGAGFGEDGLSWKVWWTDHRDDFTR